MYVIHAKLSPPAKIGGREYINRIVVSEAPTPYNVHDTCGLPLIVHTACRCCSRLHGESQQQPNHQNPNITSFCIGQQFFGHLGY
jgi:hypothetical protein